MKDEDKTKEQLITELVEMRQRIKELEAAQNSLGQIASGSALDLNCALTPILGYTDLMLNHPEILDDRKRVKQFLSAMNRTAKDAGQIVIRLREFSSSIADTTDA